jgi:hypothetical protein
MMHGQKNIKVMLQYTELSVKGSFLTHQTEFAV